MAFIFLPENKNRTTDPAPKKTNTKFQDINYTEISDTEKPDTDTTNPLESLGGMEEIISMMFSSASYKIILGGDINARKVEAVGIGTNSVYPITISKIGTNFLIKVPFMALLLKEKKGFSVNVYLQK